MSPSRLLCLLWHLGYYFYDVSATTLRWLWCQQQLSMAWISNYIPQYTVGCNYLSMPYMIWIWIWIDTFLWYQSTHTRKVCKWHLVIFARIDDYFSMHNLLVSSFLEWIILRDDRCQTVWITPGTASSTPMTSRSLLKIYRSMLSKVNLLYY